MRRGVIGWIAGLLLLSLCSEAQGARLEVALVSHSTASQLPAEIELSLRAEKTDTAPVKHLIKPGTAPQSFNLAEGTWALEARAKGIWAPVRMVVLPKEGSIRVDLDLYDAALARGQVEVEKGEPLPSEISVELYPPLREPGPMTPRLGPSKAGQVITFRCPISEGSFECAVPAGEWDVRLRASQHISHYFWKFVFPRQAPASFGKLFLRRGASVVGWVKTEGGVPKGKQVQLTLQPMSAASSPVTATSDRALSLTTQASERGFFHFTAVPPGAYTVTASLDGFAPARFFPVRVIEHAESQLQEPLVLAPPIRPEVRITPVTDLQQRPWHVQIFDLGATPGTMDKAAEGRAGEDGIWRGPGLSPGRFLVQIADAAGAIWGIQEVELAEGLTHVDFDLDFLEVEGTLSLGGEPLAGTLYFGGKMGAPSFRMESGADGRFGGHVTREGAWRVEIEAKEPAVRRSLPHVLVERSPGKQVARLAIELPGGRLHGKVTDEGGEPVADAGVTAAMVGEPLTTVRTDQKGEFDLYGYGDGQAYVQARGQGLESEGHWVDLKEGVTPPPLHLVLREVRQVTGFVLGPFGGVPGAQVLGQAPGQIRSQAVTDLSGKFSLRVPASAPSLDVVVLPPGYSLQTARFALGEKTDLQVVLEPDGGDLILEGLAASQDAPATGAILLARNGVPIDIATLRNWTEANGRKWPVSGPWTVPQAGAGQYEVCRVPFASLAARLGGDRSAGRCALGNLNAGGELTLKVPRSE